MQSCSLHQPPSDTSFGYSDLPVLPPHVLNNISGGDNAEDPAASPSLLDERVEIIFPKKGQAARKKCSKTKNCHPITEKNQTLQQVVAHGRMKRTTKSSGLYKVSEIPMTS